MDEKYDSIELDLLEPAIEAACAILEDVPIKLGMED